LVNCATPAEVVSAIAALRAGGEDFLLMGGGSNILVSDRGVDATVVRFVSDEPLIERDGHTVTVSGGSDLDAVVRLLGEQGLGGLTFCSGIPGTVGGAIVGNAGAWGKQVGDVLESVTLLAPDGSVTEVGGEDLGFAYRHSDLKEDGRIVLAARFRLAPADPASLDGERAEILMQRAERHPDVELEPCIGSFFRNIEPTSKAERRQAAGWFLEQAGAKFMRVGGARVFERHANIIVRDADGTADDVYQLAEKMKEAVRDKFGFELVREVRYVGAFGGEPESFAGFH
jgi:UDP-N-acetylmuramate dehydrogenase